MASRLVCLLAVPLNFDGDGWKSRDRRLAAKVLRAPHGRRFAYLHDLIGRRNSPVETRTMTSLAWDRDRVAGSLDRLTATYPFVALLLCHLQANDFCL